MTNKLISVYLYGGFTIIHTIILLPLIKFEEAIATQVLMSRRPSESQIHFAQGYYHPHRGFNLNTLNSLSPQNKQSPQHFSQDNMQEENINKCYSPAGNIVLRSFSPFEKSITEHSSYEFKPQPIQKVESVTKQGIIHLLTKPRKSRMATLVTPRFELPSENVKAAPQTTISSPQSQIHMTKDIKEVRKTKQQKIKDIAQLLLHDKSKQQTQPSVDQVHTCDSRSSKSPNLTNGQRRLVIKQKLQSILSSEKSFQQKLRTDLLRKQNHYRNYSNVLIWRENKQDINNNFPIK